MTLLIVALCVFGLAATAALGWLAMAVLKEVEEYDEGESFEGKYE